MATQHLRSRQRQQRKTALLLLALFLVLTLVGSAAALIAISNAGAEGALSADLTTFCLRAIQQQPHLAPAQDAQGCGGWARQAAREDASSARRCLGLVRYADQLDCFRSTAP